MSLALFELPQCVSSNCLPKWGKAISQIKGAGKSLPQKTRLKRGKTIKAVLYPNQAFIQDFDTRGIGCELNPMGVTKSCSQPHYK